MTAAPMNRTGFVGGSDARRIIEGDWLALYEEKVGIRQPEDLSDVFRVQLGSFTEPFHLDWLEHKLLMKLKGRGSIFTHPDHPWLRAMIDAWWTEHDTFLDTKHSNGRASVRIMSEQYQPQIAHYCLATGRTHGYLSFIAGNEDPVICKIEPSAAYMAELLELEKNFWWHVENEMAPMMEGTAEQFAEVNAQAKNVKVDGMRFVDMTGNNQWADLARTILDTKDAAELHDKARGDIKLMVEKDVAEAAGHGVTIKKDKRGALRFTFDRDAA